MARTWNKDLIGKKINQLMIIELLPYMQGHGRRCVARCDCGTVKEYIIDNIKRGRTVSCGCHRVEVSKAKNYIHGESHLPLNNRWKGIKQRCYNPRCGCYKYYGARGIRMCDEWRNDYTAFRDWALSNGYKEALQIDRIDNDGNYEPSNCRWVTPSENMLNRSDNVFLTVGNSTRTLSEWANILEMSSDTLRLRQKVGKSVGSLLEPVNTTRRRLESQTATVQEEGGTIGR